jgi:hypothetical protein
MVVTVSVADATNAIERVLVTNVATQRVTGIRRVHDETAVAHDLGGATDQPKLRILGM